MTKATIESGRTAFILFTDIYRSSHLWEVFPKEYPTVLEQHNRTVEEIVLARGGDIIRNLGDGYAVLFDDAAQCAGSAVAIQCAMQGAQAEPSARPAFADGTELQVRVACHGGALRRLAVGRGFFGQSLNRARRICQVCHPGQALVSQKVQVFLDGGAGFQPADKVGWQDASPTKQCNFPAHHHHRARGLRQKPAGHPALRRPA
ncbi:adenylate/guanylate cyclase domain-containing protein [bacterium]|nr:adenylate/guanylate cyclase domain-containing protein [bacterium]